MIWRIALAAPFLLLAAFFGAIFYAFYWSHRDCFNSEGRCYVAEESVVYHDGSATLAAPALVFLIIGLGIILTIFVRPRLQKDQNLTARLRALINFPMSHRTTHLAYYYRTLS